MLLVDVIRVPGLGVELGPADADLRALWEAACDDVGKDDVVASARLMSARTMTPRSDNQESGIMAR